MIPRIVAAIMLLAAIVIIMVFVGAARSHDAPQAPVMTQSILGGQGINECPASNKNMRLLLDYTVPVICSGQSSVCPGRIICNKEGSKTCAFLPGDCNVCTVPQRRYVCLSDEQLQEYER